MTATAAPLGRELMALAFEHSASAIAVTQQRRIIECNHAFCELFDYPRQELIGQSMRKLYPCFADFKNIGDRGYRCMLTDPHYADERFMQTRTGDVFWTKTSGRTLTPQTPFDLAVWTFLKIDSRTPGSARLSPREREISALVANGMTCKEIARNLGISHRTVETHRARLMKKLDCRNSAELVSKIITL